MLAIGACAQLLVCGICGYCFPRDLLRHLKLFDNSWHCWGSFKLVPSLVPSSASQNQTYIGWLWLHENSWNGLSATSTPEFQWKLQCKKQKGCQCLQHESPLLPHHCALLYKNHHSCCVFLCQMFPVVGHTGSNYHLTIASEQMSCDSACLFLNKLNVVHLMKC